MSRSGDGDPLGDELALGRPGVRSGPGRRRAGGEDEGQQDDETAAEQHDRSGHEPVAGAGGVVPAAAVEEHDRVDDQRQRGEEVDHDEVRIELRVDDDAAHDGLEQDAADQSGREPREVAPERPAAERREEGGRDDDRQEDGDHPVPELDERVELQRWRQVAGRAVRPVRHSRGRTRSAGRPRR